MRIITPVVVVIVLASFVGAQEDTKKEMANLEGEWSMVSGNASGQSLPEEA
jgi:hypothetical protein